MSKCKFTVKLNDPEGTKTFNANWDPGSEVKINATGDLEFWAVDAGTTRLVLAIARGAWLSFEDHGGPPPPGAA